MKFISIRHKPVFAMILFIPLIIFLIATGTYNYFHKATCKFIFDQRLILYCYDWSYLEISR